MKRLIILAVATVLVLGSVIGPTYGATGPTVSKKGILCRVHALDWEWSEDRSITVLTKVTCSNGGGDATLHLKWGTIVSWHRGPWLYWIIRHYRVELTLAAGDRDHWLFLRSIHIGRADDEPQVYSYARFLVVRR
jgi:hypothetical protein